jgi:hypothetical protein
MPEKSDFLWEDRLDEDGELEEPNLTLIDVNIKGTLFSRFYPALVVLLWGTAK